MGWGRGQGDLLVFVRITHGNRSLVFGGKEWGHHLQQLCHLGSSSVCCLATAQRPPLHVPMETADGVRVSSTAHLSAFCFSRFSMQTMGVLYAACDFWPSVCLVAGWGQQKQIPPRGPSYRAQRLLRPGGDVFPTKEAPIWSRSDGSTVVMKHFHSLCPYFLGNKGRCGQTRGCTQDPRVWAQSGLLALHMGS